MDHPATVPELTGEANPRLHTGAGRLHLGSVIPVSQRSVCVTKWFLYGQSQRAAVAFPASSVSDPHPLSAPLPRLSSRFSNKDAQKAFLKQQEGVRRGGNGGQPFLPASFPAASRKHAQSLGNGAAAPRGCPEQTGHKPLQTHSQASTQEPFRLLRPY